MGALTALIVTTCVAPPLIGALTAIAQTGDVARGASALFAMSMGMGAPLLLVGASAGQLLPRVGPWMNTVKAGVRRDDGRHRDLDDGARAAWLRHARALGVARVPDGRVPRRVREPARESAADPAAREGARRARVSLRRSDADRRDARRRESVAADPAGLVRVGLDRRRARVPPRGRSSSSARSRRWPRSTLRSPRRAARANR